MFSKNTGYKKRARSNHDFDVQEFLSAIFANLESSHPPEDLLNLFFTEENDEIAGEMCRLVEKFDRRNFEPEFLHDRLAVYQFLRDTKKVEPYLDQLETALQHRAASLARRNHFLIAENGQYQLPVVRENPYAHFKVLSRFLYPWACRNGFQQQGKYIGILQQNDFLSLLAEKTIFKDSSISANLDHGAWSHAIQWFCIFEHQKASRFLQHPAIEVYQSFGSPDQMRAPFLDSAWDEIVDRLDARNFTTPGEITRILSLPASMKRWPILCGSFVRQEQKSREKFGSYGGYTKYLGEKHADECDHCKIVKKLKVR